MSERFAARRIAIIGLGLIGGSLARALRRHAAVDEIVGCVHHTSDIPLARELGLADRVTTSVAQAAAGAEIVVVAVGVDAIGAVCSQMRDVLGADAIVTDVGSTKTSVITDVRAALSTQQFRRFVPGHPISGTENSGLRASVDGLFEGKRTLITPLPETCDSAVRRVEQLWRTIGACVTRMQPTHHDEVLAATSHLPHLLAFALVDTLAEMAQRTEIFSYAAGGFSDFTRIASSDPALWTRIMRANGDAVLAALDSYMATLHNLRQALQNHEDGTITASFTRAKQARDEFANRAGTQRNKK